MGVFPKHWGYVELASNIPCTTQHFPFQRLITLQITHSGLGGSVVKNPPANARDVGSIPDPRSHMLWATKPHVPQPLSSCSRAWEPQLLSPPAAATEGHSPRACAPQQEKPLKQEAHAAQLEKTLLAATRESPHSNKDLCSIKVQIIHSVVLVLALCLL